MFSWFQRILNDSCFIVCFQTGPCCFDFFLVFLSLLTLGCQCFARLASTLRCSLCFSVTRVFVSLLLCMPTVGSVISIAPAPAVFSIAPAPIVYITPAPAVYAAPAPVVKYITQRIVVGESARRSSVRPSPWCGPPATLGVVVLSHSDPHSEPFPLCSMLWFVYCQNPFHEQRVYSLGSLSVKKILHRTLCAVATSFWVSMRLS